MWQVLDDITLANLDVLDHQGQQEESLLKRIDHCSTPFGNNMFTCNFRYGIAESHGETSLI